MFFQSKLTATFIFCLLVIWINCQLYENEYGEDYGTKWLYYVDDNGTTHVMNFSTITPNNRAMHSGDAYFSLYTRRNRGNPEQLMIPENGSPIKSQYFNSSNNIKMVTHGWMSSDQTEWLQNIRDIYLRKYDYNIITVDWSETAEDPTYFWAAVVGTRHVGEKVAKLVDSLRQSYDIRGNNVHLIGHSLGAQVMGFAGMYSKEKIDRITGLDPARPLFESPLLMPEDYRLDKSDAKFVDIIHTCGGILGYKKSYGTADFYPNKGKARQPGCEGTQAMIEGCSHGKSCEFFAESIDSDPSFTAYLCSGWDSFENGECKSDSTEMGDTVSLDSHGNYYLHTRNQSRYALGDEQNQ